MVSSDEINKRLEARRRGEKYQESRERNIKRDVGPSHSRECPECHTQNPSTAKFCVGCGIKLETPPEKEEGFSPQIKGPGEDSVKKRISSRPDDFGSRNSQRIKRAQEQTPEKKLEPIVPAEENIQEPDKSVPEDKDTTPEKQTPIEPETQKTEPEITSESAPKPKPVPPVVTPEIKKPATLKAPSPSEPSTKPSVAVENPVSKQKKPDVDPVDRIKKAKELLDIGAITQEEFDAIKKKYLDEI